MIMALLRRKSESPIAVLERELSDLTSRRDALDAKLAAAADELAQAFDQRRQALLDSDLSDEVAAARRDAACRSAQDRHGSLVDALSAMGGKIADVETLLIAARDRVAREQLAATVRGLGDDLHTAALALAEAGDKAIAAMDAVVARVPNLAADFAPRARMLIKELPEALDHLVGEAYQFAVQTMDGAPIHRAPPTAAPVSVPQIVERERLYCLSPVRWLEGSQVRCSPRYSFVELPVALIEQAINANHVDRPGTERCRRMIEGFGVVNGPGDPLQSIDLDTLNAAAEQPAKRTLLPPGFEERVGPTRTMEIQVSRT
jgi:hypothetical protein